ncbi:hypothetical protein BDN70DRAFT_896079 [Pholiota conissans]|uniref:F-box domain-containing protein n=1 Tax=Pholiota conissans TaxID=109636 RepID=A0A9P6CZT3_9AGAR|nr:hypothetical protein BDN70DRAFT_896079 [Pholiota conissans]
MSELSSKLCLAGLSEDILLSIVSYLEPPCILRLGETCKRLHEFTSLRVVWVHEATLHVIMQGLPFLEVDLDELSTSDLIAHTIHGYSLAHRWVNGISSPKRVVNVTGTSGISVSDVRFVPGRDNLLVTISKSIWSALSIWDIDDGVNSKKLCEWSPRGAIFTGFALNSDENSEATIAVSLQLNDRHFVELLTLFTTEDSTCLLKRLFSVDTTMKPVTLVGDLIALTDDTAQTAIWNWKEGTYAILEHPTNNPTLIQSNECIQVVFARQSILVVRARCMYLFPFPTFSLPNPSTDTSPPSYEPIAQHSFGWVDSECVRVCPFLEGSQYQGLWPPLSILVRGESDDPWASDIHNLELYTLDPNPSFDSHHQPHPRIRQENNDTPANASSSWNDQDPSVSPYVFPTRLTHEVACLRGSLRCKQVALGRFGTAFWVQPRDRFPGGLLADIPTHLMPSSSSRNETLVAAVFPGSLNPRSSRKKKGEADNASYGTTVIGSNIFENDAGSSWTSFDYDEVGGRVALGSSFGKVTILQL